MRGCAGGMGEVYKARDTRLDRTVAIKILPGTRAADPQFRERFDREARAISQLTHPHICTLYDVGEQAGTAYLVMEYLEGETLEHRLKKGALPLDEALKIAIHIADGLSTAHRAGIVHRDLKPGNVMLTKQGAKLLDFGLAKAAVAGPVVCGVSPELAHGGTWNRDGLILFGGLGAGLLHVPSSGGSPQKLTRLNPSPDESGDHFRSFVPDGRHFLYLSAPSHTVWIGSVIGE